MPQSGLLEHLHMFAHTVSYEHKNRKIVFNCASYECKFYYVKEQQILKMFEGRELYVSLILKTIKMD